VAVVGDSLVSVGFDDTMRFTRLGATVMDRECVAMNGQPLSIATLAGSSTFAVATTNELALFTSRERIGGLLLPADKFSCNVVAMAGESELAIGCTDFKTRIYSIDTDYVFTNTATIETRAAVTALAFRPSLDFLAVGDNGRQVEVYERGTWAERVKSIWSFHTSRVNCLAWSPNGSYLASGSVDECIIVWDFNTPSKKLILPFAHSTGVTALLWLDDLTLCSVGNDFTIVTWNIPASLP
jgi:WD40 repeat protein